MGLRRDFRSSFRHQPDAAACHLLYSSTIAKTAPETYGNRKTPAFLQGLLTHLDTEIREIGLQQAHRNFAKNYRVVIETEYDSTKEDVATGMRGGGTLVVGNHSSEVDLLPLLCSLPDHRDVNIIATADRFGIGPHYAAHLLPVYLSDRALQEGRAWFTWKRMLWPAEAISEQEKRKRNTDTLERATQKLIDGATVVIFPEGAKGPGSLWEQGIGRIVDGMRDHWDNVQYLQSHISGTRNFLLELFRLVPPLQRFMPSMHVHFSTPQNVAEIFPPTSAKDPREITRQLEQHYRDWLKNIKERTARNSLQ